MSQISLHEAPNLQQIDLTKLNMRQLAQLKLQLNRELPVFQESLQTLKIAQSKFLESGECLDKFVPEAKGKPILVPLTSSMYVAGKLADTENVLIDIGTGYYAKKNVSEAKDYFKRRVAYVTEQMEKIQVIGLEKSKIRDAVVNVMDLKAKGHIPDDCIIVKNKKERGKVDD